MIPLGRVIFLRELQPSKPSLGRNFKEDGRVMLSNDEQPLNQ